MRLATSHGRTLAPGIEGTLQNRGSRQTFEGTRGDGRASATLVAHYGSVALRDD